MSNPVTIEVFCPQAVVSASKPGGPINRQVRLQSERLARDVVLSETPFSDLNGGLVVTLTNLSADGLALFQGGKKYSVTITPVE